jgi:tRNA nucleotidyltransferase/poly(A) polymerase
MQSSTPLLAAGHDVYLVGGTVRDLLLHKAPRDYDLLTTANLQQARPHHLTVSCT